MKLEVRVDEADVGQVREGQRATFTVDAYPGRTFQAHGDCASTSAPTPRARPPRDRARSRGGGHRQRRRLYRRSSRSQNPELLLRPGMTATAEIVTTERRNVLLVPNAALRWSPERDAAATRGQAGGVTTCWCRAAAGGGRGGAAAAGGGREVSIGRGSRQTVYVLGADGSPRAGPGRRRRKQRLGDRDHRRRPARGPGGDHRPPRRRPDPGQERAQAATAKAGAVAAATATAIQAAPAAAAAGRAPAPAQPAPAQPAQPARRRRAAATPPTGRPAAAKARRRQGGGMRGPGGQRCAT